MHDPMIVAFELNWPIPKIETLPNGAKWKDYKTLAIIWHNDPESDGSDDSCGYSIPKPSDQDKRIVDKLLKLEEINICFSTPYLPSTVVDPRYDYSQQLAGDSLAYVAWAWQQIAWYRDGRKKLTTGEWWIVNNLAINPADNLRHILTDFEDDERVKRFLWCVMRQYLRYHRPWYKHPRWHVHHWKIQVPFIQHLKRWLFSRCSGCGKRFRWGYDPICAKWDNGGPRWLWSEPNVYHHECYRKETTQ